MVYGVPESRIMRLTFKNNVFKSSIEGFGLHLAWVRVRLLKALDNSFSSSHYMYVVISTRTIATWAYWSTKPLATHTHNYFDI
jgi:hypothetical protein